MLEEYELPAPAETEAAIDVTPGGRPTLAVTLIGPEIRRRYVYGTDYVDELVEQHNFAPGSTTPTTYHVLQDANWNVTALTNSPTDTATNPTIVQQYYYEPHGPFAAVESGAGTPLTFPLDFTQVMTTHLFAGMTWDPILQLYCTPSGRCYDPDTGRWYQRDPNGLGFHMSTIPYYHGMTPHFSPYFSQRGSTIDGPNLYGYAWFNPNIYTDPMGYFSYFDEKADDIGAAYYADRAATQIEVIERAKMLASGAFAMADGMAKRMALETAASAVWSGAPYAFAAYDTFDAFRYIYEEGLSWESALGLGAQLFDLRSTMRVQAGFGIKPRVGQKASAGLGIDVDQGAFAFHLRSNEGGYRRPKAINLPSWKSIDIDMDHVLSGHKRGGKRVSPDDDLFPDYMTDAQIENTIRDAYRYGKKGSYKGNNVRIVGRSNGLTIEMWFNPKDKRIVTAYPIH